MKKNKISKLALLTSLLMIHTNTKGFYQCVPKEDWLEDYLYKMEVKNKIKHAEKNMNNENLWALIEDNILSGVLNMGIYKVEVAGGAGGNGGFVDNDIFCRNRFANRESCEKYKCGRGGAGEVVVKIFDVKQSQYFVSCIGKKGQDGVMSYGDSIEGGTSGGGGGAGSGFKIGDLEIEVSGGGGGGGGSVCYGGGGGGAGGYGCAAGGSGNFGNCNKYLSWDRCHPGAGGTVLTEDNWKVGYKGGDGYEDYGDIGGAGGKGKKLCSNGGAGGSHCSDGGKGSSCASSGNGNSGDGYVRIYKYIG